MAKSKKSASTEPKPKTLAEAGLEIFTVVEMHRSKLVAADYNPRHITDQERNKLKAALKRNGLVAPIIWNERTGNIVGGHQRISIMDSLMGTKDYTLQVSKIDVDLAKEKELNVVLNNTAAMGSFDTDMLKDMFMDETVTLEGAGFTKTDFVQMFGDESLNNRSQDLQEFAEHLSSISEKYTTVQEKNRKKGQSEHYLVFVFPDGDHVDAFIKTANLQDNRYQNGMALLDKWGVIMPEKDA